MNENVCGWNEGQCKCYLKQQREIAPTAVELGWVCNLLGDCDCSLLDVAEGCDPGLGQCEDGEWYLVVPGIRVPLNVAQVYVRLDPFRKVHLHAIYSPSAAAVAENNPNYFSAGAVDRLIQDVAIHFVRRRPFLDQELWKQSIDWISKGSDFVLACCVEI